MAVAERLRRVNIECRHFRDVLPGWDRPNTAVYLDPPYPRAARRCHHNGYPCQMSDEEHEELLDLIGRFTQARCVLSGYRTPLYDRYLRNWTRHAASAVNRAAHSRGAAVTRRVECLWTNA